MKRWGVLVFVLGCGEGLPFFDASDAAVDAGPFVPGPHGAFPQALVATTDAGVMTPNVIPVFFANDALQSSVESFIHQLPGSTYWSALQSEYGVGPLTASSSIVLSEAPPASATSDEVAAFIASKLDTDPSWPAPNPNNLYFLYYPQSTTLTLDSLVSCSGFLGYHFYGSTSTNASFVFAVQARCADGGIAQVDDATQNTTHELVEAATDPFLTTYATLDAPHAIWAFYPGAELGDLCELERLSYQRLLGTSLVARFWSNTSANAGHDPCAPVISGAYFNAVPVLPEQVTVTFNQTALVTDGVTVPLGTSTTLDVQLFSDALMDPWVVEAEDSSAFTGTGSPELDFAWSRTSGNNGDTLQLTLTRIKNGDLGGTEFVIHSFASPSRWHEYFAFAAN